MVQRVLTIQPPTTTQPQLLIQHLQRFHQVLLQMEIHRFHLHQMSLLLSRRLWTQVLFQPTLWTLRVLEHFRFHLMVSLLVFKCLLHQLVLTLIKLLLLLPKTIFHIQQFTGQELQQVQKIVLGTH